MDEWVSEQCSMAKVTAAYIYIVCLRWPFWCYIYRPAKMTTGYIYNLYSLPEWTVSQVLETRLIHCWGKVTLRYPKSVNSVQTYQLTSLPRHSGTHLWVYHRIIQGYIIVWYALDISASSLVEVKLKSTEWPKENSQSFNLIVSLDGLIVQSWLPVNVRTYIDIFIIQVVRMCNNTTLALTRGCDTPWLGTRSMTMLYLGSYCPFASFISREDNSELCCFYLL